MTTTADLKAAAETVRLELEEAGRRIAAADFGLEVEVVLRRPVDPATDELAARLHFARTMAEVDAFLERIAP